MDPAFEKANEIYFRLGIIYKQQTKFGQSLEVRTSEGSFVSLRGWSDWGTVLQVYCREPTTTSDGRGYLVSDRTCT